MQLKEFVNEYYLPSLTDLRESTKVGYESAIRLHILPEFGEREMEDVKVYDIERWLKSIEAPGGAEKAYKTPRQIIRRAIDWDMFDAVDPTRKRIRIPKKRAYRPVVLDARQTRALLRGFYGHELETVVICAVTLGLRRGEACGLEWSDIDLRSGAVAIRRSKQYVRGEVLVVDPKTDRSARTYDAGSEGGEETHTLTENEMPSHTHSTIGHYSGGSDYSSTVERTVEYNNERKGWWLSDDLILRAGNGKAHNNMPPYLVVYMWVRVA